MELYYLTQQLLDGCCLNDNITSPFIPEEGVRYKCFARNKTSYSLPTMGDVITIDAVTASDLPSTPIGSQLCIAGHKVMAVGLLKGVAIPMIRCQYNTISIEADHAFDVRYTVYRFNDAVRLSLNSAFAVNAQNELIWSCDQSVITPRPIGSTELDDTDFKPSSQLSLTSKH